MTPHAHLRLVPPSGPDAAPDPALAGGDLAVLGFVFAVHAVPLAAFAAGRPWGAATVGYATAVALVSGGELLRELRERCAGARAPRGDAR